MALSLSRAFGAMGSEASKFDRHKTVADPELSLMSQEDISMAKFILPGPNQVRLSCTTLLQQLSCFDAVDSDLGVSGVLRASD